MPHSTEDAFNLEVLKLLLQVAWSDHHLDRAELYAIVGLGRSWSVPEEALHELYRRLKAGEPLPSPNMSLLRSRPDEVMEAARALMLADNRIAEEEAELVSQIRKLIEGG